MLAASLITRNDAGRAIASQDHRRLRKLLPREPRWLHCDSYLRCQYYLYGSPIDCMSEAITRLNTALEGRYRIESKLGEGGMVM